jgi:transposase
VDTNIVQSVAEEVGARARTRLRRSVQEKRRIVLETLKPGASVAIIARHHSVNANQVFSWRRQYRRGELMGRASGEHKAKLLPVQIRQPASDQAERGVRSASRSQDAIGRMEIEFPGGQRLKVRGRIEAEALRVVIRELLRPC